MKFWSTIQWEYGYRATYVYISNQIGVSPPKHMTSVYLFTHFVTVTTKHVAGNKL